MLRECVVSAERSAKILLHDETGTNVKWASAVYYVLRIDSPVSLQ